MPGRALETQETQEHRLPPSHSASPSLRRASVLRDCLVLLAALLSSCGLHAQQPRPQAFLAARKTPQRTSPALALQQARAQHAAMLAQPRATNLTAAWQPLGPNGITSATFGTLTGRITALATDPNDTTGNTLYAGTTGGGVWKSTNAAGPLSAASFTPLTDALASLSIGALAVQPVANPVVLAGTGDPNDATDSYYGAGLLRSADGGLTWQLIAGSQGGTNAAYSFAGLANAGLAFSTATPSLVVAAFSTSSEANTVNAAGSYSIPGLYYSTDAGLTWQMATLYDGSQIVQSPQPGGTGQVGNGATAVLWSAQRQLFFAAVRSHGYYSSPDGITWTRLTHQPGTGLTTANCPAGVNGVGSANCPLFRGALAAQPTTGDLYALSVDSAGRDQGLWQDLCSGAGNTCAAPAPTWAARIDNGALDTTGTTTIAQGTYNLTLAAAPTASNGTELFAGTIDLYTCTLAANSSTCTLRNTTNALDGCNAPAKVAPAQHALAAVAQAGAAPLLYLGNDGGLWRSLDGVAETGPVCSASDATHFDNLNPAFIGSLAEVTAFAQHPTDANTLLAGLGANGSGASSAASALTAWPQLSAGEGGQPLLDSNTPANWWLTIGAGVNLAGCTLGSNCTATNFAPPATIGYTQTSGDTALLDAPALLDPALTTNLMTATCRVWRGPASSGATWSTANAISSAFNGSATPCTGNSPLIRSLAAGGPSSSSSSAQRSGSQVIYAGLAGEDDGGSNIAGHLFVTTNASTATPTWSDTALSPVTNDISNNHLFNPGGFDISSVAVDPHDATGATVYATVMGFGYPHLYRSTDFGAHWQNLSANLPNAPANAVLIDPNDANTVYIALDTGIYATQGITTCAAANCWSVLGTTLPNAPVVSLEAAAQMLTGDGRRGMLRASTYGRGLWQQPLLTAVSLAQPALTIAPSSLTFSAQQQGTQSAAQTLTVTSTGNAPITFGTPAITGDFAISANTCTGQLAAPSTSNPTPQCTLQIVFAPTATGPRSGQLTLYANISGGQAIVLLSGTGTAPADITFTPPALVFAATIVNQTTAAQNIVVGNIGGTTATLQTPIITGDFAISTNTCTSTLAPSNGCTVSITFTPTASGTRTGTLSLTDSAGTQIAQLSGTGEAPATDTLSPTALTFAPQQVNTSSAAQQVTLTNAGDVALTLITATLPSTDFSFVNNCGNSLAAHSTCAFSITFNPAATGARSATLTISDQFRSQTVLLSGTGLAPPGVSLSPGALTFAATGSGLLSAAQTVTLTNNGGTTLSVSASTLSPGFAVAATTCGTPPFTLAANTSCTYTLVFAPTAAGQVSGALTLTDNATPGTQTVSLTGIGIDFSLAPNGPTTATISGTATATYSLLLTSLSGLPGNVALACSGAPAHALCTVNPGTPALGGSTAVTVTVATGAVARLDAPTFAAPRDLIIFALLLPMALMRRKRLLRTGVALLCLLPLVAIEGCGAGRVIPVPSATSTSIPPTPAGTYNLTITGTTAGITHTVGLTLTVQ